MECGRGCYCFVEIKIAMHMMLTCTLVMRQRKIDRMKLPRPRTSSKIHVSHILRLPHTPSFPRRPQVLNCIGLLLLSRLLYASKVSLGPHPAVKAVFEAKED